MMRCWNDLAVDGKVAEETALALWRRKCLIASTASFEKSEIRKTQTGDAPSPATGSPLHAITRVTVIPTKTRGRRKARRRTGQSAIVQSATANAAAPLAEVRREARADPPDAKAMEKC
jgi:hypothetical protein